MKKNDPNNGRSNENHQDCLNGRVVTDEGEAKDKGLHMAVQHKNETAEKMTLSEDFADRLMQRIAQEEEYPQQQRFGWMKILCTAKRHSRAAASVIGILFVSGIAFAAIHIVRNYGNTVGEDLKSPTQETRISNSHQQALPADTTVTVTPIVFDKATLDSILSQIAQHYGYTVSFRSDKSKPLRLFLTWNLQDSIQKVTDKLNLFEQIHIVLDEQTMIVE
jgi:hypothetical protein